MSHEVNKYLSDIFNSINIVDEHLVEITGLKQFKV